MAKVAFGWSLPVLSISEEDYQLLPAGAMAEIVDGELSWSKMIKGERCKEMKRYF